MNAFDLPTWLKCLDAAAISESNGYSLDYLRMCEWGRRTARGIAPEDVERVTAEVAAYIADVHTRKVTLLAVRLYADAMERAKP